MTRIATSLPEAPRCLIKRLPKPLGSREKAVPHQMSNICLFHQTLTLSFCLSCPYRRIFGIKFKITSSTMPDDRSTGPPYISLNQPTKLLNPAFAYNGQFPRCGPPPPHVCENQQPPILLTPQLCSPTAAVNSTSQEHKGYET